MLIPRALLARHEVLACRSRSFAPARFRGPALATLACAAPGSPARATASWAPPECRLPIRASASGSKEPMGLGNVGHHYAWW